MKSLGLDLVGSSEKIAMASTSLGQSLQGTVTADINAAGRLYRSVELGALPSLCSDVILGQEFMKLHSEVNFKTGGVKPPLNIHFCGLAVAKVDPPRLFKFLNADCRPIATRSRRHNAEDEKFIEKEIQELLKSGIIEEASTPWRAQVLVARNDRHKPRVVIDYSQTINRFTQLDAYPLPRIEDQVAELSKWKFFSTLELKSAYHQVPVALEQWFLTCGKFPNGGEWRSCQVGNDRSDS